MQHNGKIQFKLPDQPYEFVAEAEKVTINASDDYIWTGKIRTPETGDITIIQKEGYTGALIHMPSNTYTIYPLKNRVSILGKHNCLDTGGGCGTPPREPPVIPPVEPCEWSDCTAEITALVILTPNAFAAFEGNTLAAQLLVGLSMEVTNIGMRNSDIKNKNITWTTAVMDVPFVGALTFENTYNVELSLDAINSNQAIQDLRDQVFADIVVIIEDEALVTGNDFFETPINGIAFTDGNYAFSNLNSILNPRFTVAHEIGHLMGAGHNLSSNIPCIGCGFDTPGCFHAFNFADGDGVARNTLVGINDDNTTVNRILHFSNPDVFYEGEETGEAMIANNASVISIEACQVAQFYANTFSVSLSGPTCLAPNDPTPIKAEVTQPVLPTDPGQPPYTFEWRWSPDGFTYFPVSPANNSNSFSLYGSLFNFDYVWVEVIVTSSDGLTESASMKIDIAPCSSSGNTSDRVVRAGIPPTMQYEKNNLNVNNDFSIFPNPTRKGEGLIQLPKDAKGQVLIFDVNGQLIVERTINGQDFMKLADVSLEKGIYFVQYREDDQNYTSIKRLIIQ